MADKSPRRVPEERAATPEEVHAAIESLSLADWARLRKFADYYIVLLGEKAGDRRGKDLLNVAFERLLQRTRKWDKTKVDFMGFLYGAIESISDGWSKKKYSPTEQPVLAAQLVQEADEGQLSDPAEEFVSTEVSPAQMLLYNETLSQIEALFVDDPEVLKVLEAFREGYDPAATRDFWGLSQKEYNTIIVRMRRTIERAGILDPTRGVRHVH